MNISVYLSPSETFTDWTELLMELVILLFAKDKLLLVFSSVWWKFINNFYKSLRVVEWGKKWVKNNLIPVWIFTVAWKDDWFSPWLTARNPNTAKKPMTNWHREGSWMKGIDFQYNHNLKHGLKSPDGSRD